MYDPSPVGYSLPISNAFTGFTTTGDNTGNPAEYNVKGNFDNGWYFYCKPNKKGSTVFFPASGFRGGLYGSISFYGTLHDVLTFGGYWVAGPYNMLSGRYLYFRSGSVFPLGFYDRAYGFAVRCAAEKQ